MNWQTFSQVAFAFDVTPRLLIGAIIYALLIGLDRRLLPRHPRGADAGGDGVAGAVTLGGCARSGARRTAV